MNDYKTKHQPFNTILGSILRNIILLVLFTSCTNSNSIFIPSGSQTDITIDGIFNSEEWEESTTVNITENNTLYLIQNEDYLFLGVRNNENLGRYVDMYITNDSIGVLNLHASMQLGERALGITWNDTMPAWNWGNNTNWSANEVKVIDESEQITFLESVEFYQGFEFKIAKDKIQSKISKIRIEIKDFMGKEDEIIFPLNSERSNTDNWLVIELD